MIVRIEKQRQPAVRHQLLSDVVWAVCNDTLRRAHRAGLTALSPVEVFLTARQFCDTLLGLSDIDEGIDYEMDDLEAEATGENDAVLVMMLASAQLQARSRQLGGKDIRKMILRIYERWCDHELFLPLLEQFASKEAGLWLQGKRFDLLNYELREIKIKGGGSEEIRQLFEDMVGSSDTMDLETVKGNLFYLNRYNIEHHHAYDKEILAIYDKLIDKLKMQQNVAGDFVMTQNVDKQVSQVAAGGVGFQL